MKIKQVLITSVLSLTLVSCVSSSCPPESVSYLAEANLFPAMEEQNEALVQPSPIEIELDGKIVSVDRIISGPVCNDRWQGMIYVTCDIQVPTWEKDAFFWQECDLEIEEGTIVYVEAHNNEPYDEGCSSCHE